MSILQTQVRYDDQSDGPNDQLHVFIEVGPKTDSEGFVALVSGLSRGCAVTLVHPLPTRWYEQFAVSGGLPLSVLREEARVHAVRLCEDLARSVPTSLICDVIIGTGTRGAIRRRKMCDGAAEVLILTQLSPARRWRTNRTSKRRATVSA